MNAIRRVGDLVGECGCFVRQSGVSSTSVGVASRYPGALLPFEKSEVKTSDGRLAATPG